MVNETLSTTQLDLTAAPGSITTELGTSSSIDLTLTGSAGFAGPVALAGTLIDATEQPISGWSLTIEPATVNVPPDGVAHATATVTIPTRNQGLAGSAHFVATSAAGLGIDTAVVPITVLNRYTIGMTLDGVGQCVYPPAGTVTLTTSTKLRWLNTGSDAISIHTSGIPSCPHQQAASPPGSAYECTLGAPGQGSWYCHSPGPNVSGLNIQVVAP